MATTPVSAFRPVFVPHSPAKDEKEFVAPAPRPARDPAASAVLAAPKPLRLSDVIADRFETSFRVLVVRESSSDYARLRARGFQLANDTRGADSVQLKERVIQILFRTKCHAILAKAEASDLPLKALAIGQMAAQDNRALELESSESVSERSSAQSFAALDRLYDIAREVIKGKCRTLAMTPPPIELPAMRTGGLGASSSPLAAARVVTEKANAS